MDASVTLKMTVSELDTLRLALSVFEREEKSAAADSSIESALRRGHSANILRATVLLKKLS